MIAYLTTHFCIERSLIEYQFIEGLLLLLYTTVTKNLAITLGEVPTCKLSFAFFQDYPIVCLNCGCVTSAFLLLLHLGVETSLVYFESVLMTDEFGQVEGEAISVEQGKCLLAFYYGLALLLCLSNNAFQHIDTC